MERASDFLKRLNDSLVCDICLLIFDKPTSLPCGHTFCFSCIQRCCEHTRNRCPVCRRVVSRPVKELPVNYALQSEIADLLQSTESLCQVCCEKGEDRKLEWATARCRDCHKSLCDSCSAQHVDTRHSLTSLQCSKHQRQLELYCSNCRSNICVLCYSESHRSHECDAISKVAEKLADSLKHDIDRLESRRSRLVEAQTVVQSQREKYAVHLSNLPHVSSPATGQQLPTRKNVDSFMTKKLKAVSEVVKRYEKGMSDNYRQAQATIQGVSTLVSHFIAELNRHEERLRNDLECVEELKKRAIDISHSPSPCDVANNKERILALTIYTTTLLQRLASSDAESTSPVLLSSEGDDQLEVLMQHVTVLKGFLPPEQTPASSSSSSTSSSPSQPPPASEERNHGDENSPNLRPPVEPEPPLRGGQTPAGHQEPAEQPQRQPKQVRNAPMSPVVNELQRKFARRRQADATGGC